MASSPFFESKQDENRSIESMLHQQSSSVATTAPKKKRNQPGTPYPDAEVVALSPKTLMATNRFICEVCNKGFQREQNLQLHRRGHNLPWKLKQKSNKEVRRKVYLCPEPSCVHHHAARALRDLTGIKKHYFRKHGEKKWKCDKCSKRYAVQSDWKAHSKTCGTREYRCDCGTLFSRRDSFITHRAFCDALAQESARLPSSMSHHLYGTNHMSLGLSQMQDRPSAASATNMLGNFSHQSTSFIVAAQDPNQQGFHDQEHGSFPNNKSLQGLMQLPDLQGASANTSNLFNNLGFFSNNDNGNMNPSKNVDSTNGSAGFLSSDQFSNDGAIGGQGSTMMFSSDDIGDHVGSNLSSFYVHHENVSPHMSATALLQKAAQMGSTTSSSSHNPSNLLRSAKSERQIQMENDNHLQGIMNSLANRNVPSMFGGVLQPQNPDFGGFNASRMGMGLQQHDRINSSSSTNNNNASFSDERIRQSMGGSDKLTLDFLGVGGMVRNMGVGGMSQKELQLGINMSSINPADHLKPASFESSKLQRD